MKLLRKRESFKTEREREWFLSRFSMNSSLQYRKIREFELCSKPFASSLLLLLRKDGNATMQSKGDVSDTWCTKIVRRIRFPFARGWTPRISPFSKIVPGNVYRTGRAVSALNPLLSFKRIYTDFLISFPVYNLPIFHHFYLSPFLFHCFHSVHAQHHGSIGMNESKIFTISSDFYIIFLYLIRILHLFSFYLHRIL